MKTYPSQSSVEKVRVKVQQKKGGAVTHLHVLLQSTSSGVIMRGRLMDEYAAWLTHFKAIGRISSLHSRRRQVMFDQDACR